MVIGHDKNGEELELNCIYKFTIDKKEYEGILTYDDSEFAFVFDMIDNKFPSILLLRVDAGSIEIKYNINEINDNDELYAIWSPYIQQ